MLLGSGAKAIYGFALLRKLVPLKCTRPLVQSEQLVAIAVENIQPYPNGKCFFFGAVAGGFEWISCVMFHNVYHLVWRATSMVGNLPVFTGWFPWLPTTQVNVRRGVLFMFFCLCSGETYSKSRKQQYWPSYRIKRVFQHGLTVC